VVANVGKSDGISGNCSLGFCSGPFNICGTVKVGKAGFEVVGFPPGNVGRVFSGLPPGNEGSVGNPVGGVFSGLPGNEGSVGKSLGNGGNPVVGAFVGAVTSPEIVGRIIGGFVIGPVGPGRIVVVVGGSGIMGV
jgi:hypothetical protein